MQPSVQPVPVLYSLVHLGCTIVHSPLPGAYTLSAPGGLAGRPPGGAGEVRGAGLRVCAPHLHVEGVAALQGAARKQEVGYDRGLTAYEDYPESKL